MKKFLFFLVFIQSITYGQIKNNPDHEPPVIVNYYTEVLGFEICTNEITVSDATNFRPGDTVLMIQMKGAIIDTTNTAAFGTILDYGNAGNYEFNYISQKSGNTLKFLNRLTRSYDIPEGVVQLVRVPKFKNGYFIGGLTCPEWDGKTGGVLALFSTFTLTSEESLTVTGKGFRGANGYNSTYSTTNCGQNDYYYPFSSQYAALKGESIGNFSQSKIKGKGNYGGGGGGGNSQNSGGGGGANAGTGGNGGYQTDSCNNAPFNNGGIGGRSLQYNSNGNKIFMGSGAGSGHIDNAGTFVPGGGNGGGIIIVIADTIDILIGIHNHYIEANGNSANLCGSSNCSDGNGGGGAGGTILVSYAKIAGVLDIEAKGGNGANSIASIIPGGRTGPGGGGGGGVVYTNGINFPVNVTFNINGGIAGVVEQDANNPWGATAGAPGTNFFNWVPPINTILFTSNIDSVRIKDSVNYCNSIQFNGLGYTNRFPVASWYWDFGDGTVGNSQNPLHDFNAVANYNVKLIVTDVNGCKDSITKTINTAGVMLAEAGNDTTLCVSGQTSIALNGYGTGNYLWSPAAVLNNNTIQNPIATINTSTKFYLTTSNGLGCSALDSVTITVNQNPIVKTLADTAICKNANLVLTTFGATNYVWSPGVYVNDSIIASPQFIDSVSRILIVTGTSINGCKASDTINVNVKTPVTFNAPQGKTICKGESVQLNGNNSNAFQYAWTPTFYLNNPNIKNPVANPLLTTVYTVTITDKTCNYDSSFQVNVFVLPIPLISVSKSNDINCNKPFAQLNANGSFVYSWTPNYALNNNMIANPIANPTSSTTYYVIATDITGCKSTDSIRVLVNFGNDGILLPNSFTPNNDGVNDCFGIKYYREVQNLDFIIYNRFGNIVFETHTESNCWDGYIKGQPAEPGTYMYFIKAKTLCGDVIKKGTVLLLR